MVELTAFTRPMEIQMVTFVMQEIQAVERLFSQYIRIKTPGEALSTFIWASQDRKGEEQVWVTKSLRYGYKYVNLVKNGRFLDPLSIFEL